MNTEEPTERDIELAAEWLAKNYQLAGLDALDAICEIVRIVNGGTK